MARRISILNVAQTGANPGSFTIGVEADNSGGDWTPVFQGKFYRDGIGSVQAFYTSPTVVPAGFTLIEATTFSVVENARYSGRYTVYTMPSAGGLSSSTFSGGSTVVRVNEIVPAPTTPGDLSTGFITNVSTYYVVVAGESAIVVPPTVNISTRPIDFIGRNFSGWGEAFTQNIVDVSQNFAGTSAPTNPFIGQTWFNPVTGSMQVWNGSWALVNTNFFATASPPSYRHVQTTAATTWTINHGLGSPAPFIVHASFFVDIGGGVIKPANAADLNFEVGYMPTDVTYVTVNQMTVTFDTAQKGYALIRL